MRTCQSIFLLWHVFCRRFEKIRRRVETDTIRVFFMKEVENASLHRHYRGHALLMAHFLRFLFHGKGRRQSVTADVIILSRQLHPCIAAACLDTRFAHAAASHEWIKHTGLRSRHSQQVLNQRHWLTGQVNLLHGNHRVGIHARKACPRVRDKASLGGENHIFALLPEFADLRAGTAFIPSHNAPPCPTCRLHSVSQCRKLPPVRKHHERRTLASNAPAFAKP